MKCVVHEANIVSLHQTKNFHEDVNTIEFKKLCHCVIEIRSMKVKVYLQSKAIDR